jgi:hypothetical protein
MTRRLVNAEVLKLRKRRGLVVTTSLLTVGAVVVVYVVLLILHAANPAHHGPAGGIANLGHGLGLLTLLGSVAAALVGAAAGAGDLSAGIFRELVVTGHPRLSLFAARIPGGLLFLLPFVAVAYLLAALASVAFAGSLAAPSVGLMATGGVWALAQTAFYFLLGLGLASLVGSRSTAVGVLLALRLALTPVLLAIAFLGSLREAIPAAAFVQLAPDRLAEYLREGPDTIAMSAGAAVLVIVAWTAAWLALGAWRTQTRDA